MKDRQRQAVKAALLSHVIGDALGVPAEFFSREQLAQHPVEGMLSSDELPKGSWSDDSSMMLCTLVSITEKRKLDFDDMMYRFSCWVRDGYMTPHGKAFGLGRTTVNAVNKYIGGESAEGCGFCSERDNGNGSLMRILPISLYLALKADGLTQSEKDDFIVRASALTHAHKRSCTACGIFTFTVEELLKNPDKQAVICGLNRAREYYSGSGEYTTFKRLFSEDFAEIPENEIKSSGYVADTIEAAVWCLLNTDSYRECVLKAVNLGDDTDTTAAVTGGLAGLLYGLDDIPQEWRDETVKIDEIEKLCDKFIAFLAS